MIISLLLLALVALAVAYLYLLAIASILTNHPITDSPTRPMHAFAIAIPAHDEETVIAATVRRLLEQDYARTAFHIFVVADHCTDRTAKEARGAGAFCFERNEEPRGSKGAALAYLFERIFANGADYDAVVVFDADTRVDTGFLRAMDARLQQGERAVQGCHRILNPQDGWFPALTWAMFIVDNRYQNQGRANLGWSAKNMGDSICFRADVLKQFGWGRGLTEDYEFRQRLLLEGIKIAYEPAAIGYGEAPTSWAAARAQRTRWLSGTFRASRRYAGEMLKAGLARRDSALVDGAVQAFFPSYSTLTLMSVLILLGQVLLPLSVAPALLYAWAAVVIALAAYPMIGLFVERAPARAYVAMLIGPMFILWRTALSVRARLSKRVVWVRTARRDELPAGDVGK
ncbi:MAG: glycosyltransferase family 2 protein [Chloroflexi bacterium]|nr:glycosyltransferase family 2 protein [Chloroflexota bacterium]